jgi:hypothetical protein
MATMGATHKQVPKRPPQNGKGTISGWGQPPALSLMALISRARVRRAPTRRARSADRPAISATRWRRLGGGWPTSPILFSLVFLVWFGAHAGARAFGANDDDAVAAAPAAMVLVGVAGRTQEVRGLRQWPDRNRTDTVLSSSINRWTVVPRSSTDVLFLDARKRYAGSYFHLWRLLPLRQYSVSSGLTVSS